MYSYNGIMITRNMTIKDLINQFKDDNDASVYIKNKYNKRATEIDFDSVIDIDSAITIDPNPYCKSILITCHILENNQNNE